MHIKHALIAAGGILTVPVTSHAATMIRVEFEAVGPVAFAPALVAAHDGTFDFFDTGSAASANLEVLAELGDVSGVQGDLPGTANSIVLTGSGGPPIPVGATSTGILSVDDGNGFLSVASMLLPSSDYFIGNNVGNSLDISSLLNAANGTSLTFNFDRVYDAGTEVNDFLTSPGGPLVGAPAGTATDGVAEGGVITLVSGPDPFGSFANAGSFDTTGIDFTSGNVATVRLTVVPEPSSMALLGLGGLAFFLRRRR